MDFVFNYYFSYNDFDYPYKMKLSRKEYLKEYYQKPEVIIKRRADNKKYREKSEVKEKRAKYLEEWKKKNKNRIKEKMKDWWIRNKDKKREYRLKPENRKKEEEYRQGEHYKEYQKEYRKRPETIKHYKEHRKEYLKKPEVKEYLKKHQKERRKKISEDFLSRYKIGKSCAFCGYNEHPEILQFHHKDRKQKSFTIARKTFSSKSLPLIEAEMNKCLLLCSNCHDWLHYKENKNEPQTTS